MMRSCTGSRTGERVWAGTLGTLGTRVDGVRGRTQPGVIVIGDVVGRRTPLDLDANGEDEAFES